MKTIRAAGQYEGEVFAQVFEGDLDLLKVGQKAIVEVPAYNKKYEGAVNSIDLALIRLPGPYVCVSGLNISIKGSLSPICF